MRPISRDEVWAKLGRTTYSGLAISGRRVSVGGLDMSALVSTAFRVNPRLIVGVPLVSDSLVSIEAIMPEGATKDQLPEMLRALLEERFHLKTHLQDVEQSGYALVPGKGTVQLNPPREIDLASCSPWTDDPRVPGGKVCQERSVSKTVFAYTDSEWGPIETVTSGGKIRDEYFRVPMAMLVSSLATHLSNQISGLGDGPDYTAVVDRTGLSGEWDVVLERTDFMSLPAASRREAYQSYDPLGEYSAAMGKVGLRLQKSSVRVQKLVVDHVDPAPTEN